MSRFGVSLQRQQWQQMLRFQQSHCPRWWYGSSTALAARRFTTTTTNTTTAAVQCHLLSKPQLHLSHRINLLRTLSSKASGGGSNSNNNSNSKNTSYNSKPPKYGRDTSSRTNYNQNNTINAPRHPIVLTNMKSSPGSSSNSTSSNYRNSYYRQPQPQQQQYGVVSTSSILAAQLPKVLSRLTILKYRHAPLLAAASSKSNNQNALKFPNIPKLSQLLTNYNHGGGIGGTRAFSTSSSSSSKSPSSASISPLSSSTIENIDEEMEISETNAAAPEVSSTPLISVFLYAVYGKRDFMSIQQSNYVERPISSKALDQLVEEQEQAARMEANEAATEGVESDVRPVSSSSTVSNEEGEDLTGQEKEEEGEDMVTFAVEADLYSLPNIHTIAEEQFGTSKNLQYYHTGIDAWCNLQDEKDLDLFQTFFFERVDIYKASQTRVVVPVRIPEYYVEEDDPDGDEDNIQQDGESNVHSLEAMIEHLLEQLIKSKWMCEEHNSSNLNMDASSNASSDPNPSTGTQPKIYRLMKEVTHDSHLGMIDESMSVEPMTSTAVTTATPEDAGATLPNTTSLDDVTTTHFSALSETTTIMPNDERPTVTKTFMYMNTKDYILSCASKDASLRGLLFYYPNSLDHIVECLHYKFLWDNFYLKDLVPADRDPSMSEENGEDGEGEERPPNNDDEERDMERHNDDGSNEEEGREKVNN